MAVTLEKLEGEPIVIATYTQTMTLEDVKAAYTFTEPYLDEIEGTIYRINDVQQVKIDFPMVTNIIKDSTQQLPASTQSERVQPVFVGRSNMIDIVRDAMAKFGKSLPVFESIDKALEGIRLGMMGREPE